MKTVLLAGGKGTRIGEESQFRPKPMVGIGGRPILWHIMKYYSSFGLQDYIVCCGYKGHMIKEYFLKYYQNNSNFMIDFAKEEIQYNDSMVENWNVTLVNTGLNTLTAGRVKQIKKYVQDEEFLLTYGDGVADVDIHKLIQFHHENGGACTITVTKPAGRFGAVSMNKETGEVYGFKEKARSDQSYVNAGYMICTADIFQYLGDGSEMLEAGPFERLIAAHQLNAYIHDGFWSPMDNLRDKEYLEGLWASGQAPWKIWQE